MYQANQTSAGVGATRSQVDQFESDPVRVGRTPHVAARLQELSCQIEALDHRCESLEKRLAPVAYAGPVMGASAEKSDSRQGMCQLAECLDTLARRVSASVARLAQLEGSIEL